MKKVVLIGLCGYENLGDQFIADTAAYLIENSNDEIELKQEELYPPMTLAKSLKNGQIVRYLRWGFSLFFAHRCKGDIHKQKLLEKSITAKAYSHYKKVLKDADAVIYAGGSIRYKVQGIYRMVELLLRVAEDYHIPVMLNAVGIEGYSPTDWRCQNLKHALNLDCVKVITTRDDLTLLQNAYLTRKEIRTAQVGDPAFWIPKCYGIQKQTKPVIGVGLVNAGIFQRNGIDYSPAQVTTLYKDILAELDRRQYQWILFSNGMQSDFEFGKQLVAELQLSKDKLLPNPTSPSQLLETISEFKGIFAGRMHAYIGAYAMDIPAIGMAWNEKWKLLGEVTQEQQRIMAVGELSGAQIVDRLESQMQEPYQTVVRTKLMEATNREIAGFLNKYVIPASYENI